ncbi:MAG: urease accessory protein UreD [Rhizobiaceae bacterium]|nr:urease accessory protein UreD [Rhizobiaceae bacterium]
MPAPDPMPGPQRARGMARLATKSLDGRSRIDVLYQEGAGKIRLPRSFDGGMEAVLINTAGGLTGGDRIEWNIAAGADTRLTVTTQACERIYKSSGGVAHVGTRLAADAGSVLHWLPQETILFDRSALHRALDADLSGNAELVVLEAVLLGRAAMGETVGQGSLRDRWRIRRNGRLVHAEELNLAGAVDRIAARRATLAGNRAFATLLYVGDRGDSLMRRLRALLDDRLAASSQWNGKLTIRIVAEDGFTLRKMLMPVISLLRNGEPPPKVWTI